MYKFLAVLSIDRQSNMCEVTAQLNAVLSQHSPEVKLLNDSGGT